MNTTDAQNRTDKAGTDSGGRSSPPGAARTSAGERPGELPGGTPALPGVPATLSRTPEVPFDAAVESSLNKAAAQVHQVLSSLDASGLKAELEADTTKFTRLVNALARLSEAGLKREWQRARLLERKARQNGGAPDQPGGITPETLKRIQEELELL